MAMVKRVKPQNMLGGYPPIWREFAKLLIGNGYGRYRVDQYFCWMLQDCLRDMGVKIETDLPEDAREKVFQLSKTFGKILRDSDPFTDILGPIYMQSAQGNDYMGQYFTPAPVATMMAEMLMMDSPADRDRLVTACDPTSGSGVMMLSMAQVVLRRHGKEALANLSLTCVDLDSICSLMCAVQLLGNCMIHGLTLGEILVCNGNSLKPADQWRTIVHATRSDIAIGKDVLPADHPMRKEAVAQAAEVNQIDLFPWYKTAVNE